MSERKERLKEDRPTIDRYANKQTVREPKIVRSHRDWKKRTQ